MSSKVKAAQIKAGLVVLIGRDFYRVTKATSKGGVAKKIILKAKGVPA